MAQYNELLDSYGYPAELIDIEYPVYIREDEQPRWADIVVCTDKERKRPFLVVETKKPNKTDGEKQGQRYATILRAVYVLWTNGTDRSASVIVNRYPEDATPIDDIPPYGGRPKYKVTSLAPFKDDKQITTVFRRCHDLIRNLSHLKPDEAFGEFLKLLLVKIQDEARKNDFEFQVVFRGAPPEPESANETAQRVRQMFKIAADEDSEVADVFRKDDDIALTNDCIAKIVKELQRHSFQRTPVDQKGRAFETFISGDMRQEFKEFMTPRPVVDAMVRMARPNRLTLILDPCCGSAAFLINSLNFVLAEIEKGKQTEREKAKYTFDFSHDKLWGFDASKQMASVARIAMIMNDDGRAHVFHHDALSPRESSPEPARQKKFKLILTNPPFGKRISAPASILSHFTLANDAHGRTRKHGSFLTEVLFLERNLTWLDKDGLMFIVLPDSVLSNATLTQARAQIEADAQLVAVISLSSDTFGPSGAKSKTSIVVLRKRDCDRPTDRFDDNAPVFVAHAPNVGFDFTGRATHKTDLPEIVAQFRRFVDSGKCKSSLCKIVSRSVLGNLWLAQLALGAAGTAASGARKLDSLCENIATGKTAPRPEYASGGKIHLVKVGNLTGRGLEWCAVERQFVSEAFLKKHPGALLEPGDILFTAAAHGPKWIGLKVDIFEAAPPHLDQRVMFCGELMRVRLRKDSGIDPYFLLLFLRSSAGYAALQNCIRGQSGHIYPTEVKELSVPDPATIDMASTARAVAALQEALKQRDAALALEHTVASVSEKIFPAAVKKPIIAL